MRKVLLGTTALAAAALIAAPAMADDMMEEPVSVGVGGYTTGAIGFYSNSDDATRGHDISYVYEVGISGSTTLDNGITVSVSGQIGRSSGNPGNVDNFDEIHTTLSGSFGSLRLGRTESAAFNATVAAPGAAIGGMIGVNYDWFSGAGGSVNTYSGLMEDALKVVYTTPNFNGLTVGVSYAPEDSEANFTGRSTAGLGEHVAAGATYSMDFMEGGSVTIGAGYEMASYGDGGDDPSAMKFGINIGVDEVSVGGSMYDVDGGATQFDVGASYAMGPIELGLQFANKDDGGDTSKTAAGLTYTLGSGVLIGGQAAIISSDGADDVTQVILGTSVFF